MKDCLPSFFIFVLLLNAIRADVDDSVAMLELANAIQPLPENWSTVNGTDYCNWNGVLCDSTMRVIDINLANKNLSGILPTSLSTLSHLRFLTLEGNKLSGRLPNLANLSSLQRLVLGSNKFSRIPEGFFQGLTNLQVLNMSLNGYLAGWSLPYELSQSTELKILDASFANLKGTIPDIFSWLRNLEVLNLTGFGLTGSLPASFANSTIQDLCINNYGNRDLTGNIDVLASMKKLQQASLRDAGLTGPIPDFSDCKELSYLDLGYNQLTGPVPKSLLTHPKLITISLEFNWLQGPKPEIPAHKLVISDENNFCYQDNTETEDTVEAGCDSQVTLLLNIASAFGYPLVLSTGWFGNDTCLFDFITCGFHNSITTVNFGYLNLSGTISSQFANLTGLKNLLLNENNLTGPVPEMLTKLPDLQFLDLSNNNLNGTLPVFASSVTVITKGNPFLTTSDGPGGVGQKPMPHLGKKANPFLITSVLSFIFIAISIFILLRLYITKRYLYSPKPRSQDTEIGGDFYSNVLSQKQFSSHVDGGNGVISIEFLQRVTDNFSETNLLGRGGFGVVYKGILDDGTFIAVKRMGATKELEGFQAEIKVLSEVRHRHLVAFLGYCINSDEKILVYEYMPQGTLRQHLFEWRDHGFHPLTWKQRVTISLDVARGVEYLHSLAQESFIHRDLKPSNILLGDDMRAKVADFGLVKKASNGRYSTETNVAGTFGYLAPEYAATGKVTPKVDVYAFGVILMEMITGTKAVDETVVEEGWMRMHLVTRYRNVLTENKDISEAIDKVINPDDDTLRSITAVAKLAVHCTYPEPDRRPDMSHVVNTLLFLLEDWRPPQLD